MQVGYVHLFKTCSSINDFSFLFQTGIRYLEFINAELYISIYSFVFKKQKKGMMKTITKLA